MPDFQGFKKIPRWSRDVIITEKIDGTNAQVCINRTLDDRHGIDYARCIKTVPDLETGECLSLYAASRTRWITPDEDNHGFARWVDEHADELIRGLGEGTHYGEWWGSGIQRGYDLPKGEKRFSLFNTGRWRDAHGTPSLDPDFTLAPECCYVVPVVAYGVNAPGFVEEAITTLEKTGSLASKGFMRPEGIIVYHVAGGHYYKKTIEKDEKHKYEG